MPSSASVSVLVRRFGDVVDVLRLALLAQERHHLLHFAVRHERAVHAGDAAAAAMYSMSPWPSSCSAPCSPRMVRLSNLLITWKLMRVGKFALMVPVITSTDGRWVAMITWIPAARAICASRCTAASISLPATIIRSAISSITTTMNGSCSSASGCSSKIGLPVSGIEAGLHPPRHHLAALLGLGHPLVVAADVAHAELAHRAVAALHLPHRPFQRHHRLAGSVTTGAIRCGMPS